MIMRKYSFWLYVCALFFSLTLSQAQDAFAAKSSSGGIIRGVGSMGYGAPAQGSRPGGSFGSTPGDYRRGYEGAAPGSDPWNREADFKARDYQIRHSPPPQYAAPPPGKSGPEKEAPPLPSLPKPPLPGDRDMPAGSP